MTAQLRLVVLTLVAILVGLAGGLAAAFLLALIHLFTNIAFFHRIALTTRDPSDAALGVGIVLVPVVGAVIVGIMARFGSEAIRGHGIPEVMDRVLHAESRIAPRLTVLKPLSAAIAIGTGGPFGAEGPIIATGGALGSLMGQLLHVTADERKTLLAAGAAAGMAATFGAPVAAVLLTVELLLFEYRARSIVPVALASCAAMAVRLALFGSAPVFPMPDLHEPTGTALATYALLGALMGVVAVGITRALYAVEDMFERLPVHWMWWPVIGAVVVGVLGYFQPRILGVGYGNITAALSGKMVVEAVAALVVCKFIAWAVYLGSGTSGGTLAPLFTFGSGAGAVIGGVLAAKLPSLGIAPPVAALVGMAAIFSGACRALLTSVVFAFETTRQPLGLLPLLAGCSASYLVSRSMMRYSLLTEKLARRGVLVQDEYTVDYLARVAVSQAMSKPVATLSADADAEHVAVELSRASHPGHQGFPVIDAQGELVGVLTRRDFTQATPTTGRKVRDLITRAPVVTYADQSLREAADIMVRNGVGRLPVVERGAPRVVVGIITRSDLLRAHAPRLQAAERRARKIRLEKWLR